MNDAAHQSSNSAKTKSKESDLSDQMVEVIYLIGVDGALILLWVVAVLLIGLFKAWWGWIALLVFGLILLIGLPLGCLIYSAWKKQAVAHR